MLWDLSLQRAVKSRDVIFHEDLFPGLGSVGRKTTEDWEDWEQSIGRRDRTATRESQDHGEVESRQDPVIIEMTPDASRAGSPTPSLTLEDRMDRRLEASVHNLGNQSNTSIQALAEDRPDSQDSPEQEPVAAPSPPASQHPSPSTRSPSPVAIVPVPTRRSARESRRVDRYGYVAQALLMAEEREEKLFK